MTKTLVPVDAGRLAGELLTLELNYTTSWPDEVATAARVEQAALLLGRDDLVLRVRLVQATIMLRDGDTVSGGRRVHQVYAAAAELGDDYLLARCHRAMALFFRLLGDEATALEHAVQCMSHTGGDVPAAMRTRHLMCLAVLLGDTGSPDEALRTFTEALALATAIGDTELAVDLLNNMAYTAFERGDLAAAEELEARMRAVAGAGDLALRATCLDTSARIAMLAGRYADVEVILAPVLADDVPAHLLDEGNALDEALLTAAEAQRERGDIAVAQATLDRAARRCAEGDLAGVQARVREQQALLYAATGSYREAFEEYRRFHNEAQVLTSAQQDARSRALQAVYQAEEARLATDAFRELALRDALTGLHNRRYVDEQLPVALAAGAVRGLPVAVALIDLDHFKRVNDQLSHEVGDAVLRRFAGLLTATVPPDALVARLGGEEFVVVLPEAGDAAGACERIRAAVAGDDWSPVTGGLPVTCSIGFTTVVGAGPTPASALADADRNLYAAKRTGRNRVCGDPVTAVA